MNSPAMLDDADSWKVSGVRTAEEFFRAVPLMVPDATHMFLEGSPDPAIVALMIDVADETAYRAPIGTIWSWPRNQRFSVRVSEGFFVRLAEAATHFAEPEVCTHVHFYRGQEILVQWFDAFSDPLLISKSVPRERVERFCAAVGGTLLSGAF